MARNKHDVTIIRKALEGVLSPPATSAVLFEALGEFGRDVPQSTDELKRLVNGPLNRALTKKLGTNDAHRVVSSILENLDDSEPEIIITEIEPVESAFSARGEVTAAVPTATAAVSVAVVAAGAAFAKRLLVALGERRVAPIAVQGTDALLALPQPPSIVLVDATDFPRIEPNGLVAALRLMPATTCHVVWASELPYARRLLAAMRDGGVPSVPLGRDEGIAPLLDLIRSRRKAV